MENNMENNMYVRKRVLGAKRAVALSLIFTSLDILYQIELDEQEERIELDIDECKFNQKVLEFLRDTIGELKKMYIP